MKPSLIIGMALALLCVPATAADLMASDTDLDARMQRLETETQSLRAELQWLRDNPVRLPEVVATPASMSTMAPEPDGSHEYYTLTELKSIMKDLVWTKGNLKITPYGYLWGNMVYNTERTSPTDRSYPFYVFSAQDQGEDSFIVDGRNTRLGLTVEGPPLWPFRCAKVGGVVEFDFQNDITGTENKGGVLLRHAYVEAKNEDYRLLFGQTWDVVSPLYPGTILYTVYWNIGNIGYRRGQLRGERYLAFSDDVMLTLQGSLNQNIFSDVAAAPNARSEPTGWPVIESRVALTLGERGKKLKPIELGVSGHVGETGFDILAGGLVVADDVRRRTWSINSDLQIPITERLGLLGEFFAGENLSSFLGGIGQGINPASYDAIRTQGGWAECYYFWRPWLHSHFGYGLDDPLDQDIAAGGRTYNQFYFGNICYDVTPTFRLGLEVASLRTLYNGKQPGDSTRIELMARYGF